MRSFSQTVMDGMTVGQKRLYYKTCPWFAVIRLKSISSASSVRSLYVGTSLLQYSSLLHRLTNDSSLAQLAAEHGSDHDGAQ